MCDVDYSMVESNVASDECQCEEYDGVPYDLLLQIVQYLFESPPTSVAELKDIINVNPANSAPTNAAPHSNMCKCACLEKPTLDIQLFPVRIRVSDRFTALLAAPQLAAHIEHQSVQYRPAVVSLAGDATFTANYRLGVGVNSCFAALHGWGNFLRALHTFGTRALFALLPVGSSSSTASVPSNLAMLVAARNSEMAESVSNLVQFQLSTIYYEVLCNLVVFFDPNERRDLLHSQVT